jgi:hypothetical protein
MPLSALLVWSRCGLGILAKPGNDEAPVWQARPIATEMHRDYRLHVHGHSAASGAGDSDPFPWRERAAVATDRPPRLVARVLWGEIKWGRVESDGNGKIRLRAGALPEDVIEALARFVD